MTRLLPQVQHLVAVFFLDGTGLLGERVPLKLAGGGKVAAPLAVVTSGGHVVLAPHLQ
jgi:hypothetical protein